MATTLTGSKAAANFPLQMPSGSESVILRGRVDAIGTLSASYTVLLCKIPNQATVMNTQVAMQTEDGAVISAVIKLGTDSDDNAFVSASASATVHNMGETPAGGTYNLAALPYKVSVTDNAANQFEFLKFIASVATSASASINVHFMVEYRLP